MDAPKCKLCGVKHLLTEPHVFGYCMPPIEKSAALGKKHCKTCRCFPMTAAERQKAYRERHKAKR